MEATCSHLPASSESCRLLVTLLNSLDLIKALQKVEPDCASDQIMFLKQYFEKSNVEKICGRQNS